MGTARVCLGAIAGAHGVRGAVRIKYFTETPDSLAAYGPVSDEGGEHEFMLTVIGHTKDLAVATIAGVVDRDAAEALKGLRLYVARAALPPPADEEFYHVDLIGLAARRPDGAVLGRVVAIHDGGGGGEFLEIAPDGGGTALMVPFTRAAVPEIDLAAGAIVVALDAEQSGEGAQPR